MTSLSETIFAFVLLNLTLGLLLYSVVIVYRFVMSRVLKFRALGSCALIFTPPSILLFLFLKSSDWVVLPITILGSLGLIYDFFQNYKKYFLLSCISLSMAHLCGVVIFACFPQSKLALLACLCLANFGLFFSCFGKVGSFVKIFCISLTMALVFFCLALLESQGIQSVLVGYFCIYCMFYLCAIFLVIIRLFSSLARAIRQRRTKTKPNFKEQE